VRGEVDTKKLALNRPRRRNLAAYVVDARTSIAARQIEKAGVELYPSETV